MSDTVRAVITFSIDGDGPSQVIIDALLSGFEKLRSAGKRGVQSFEVDQRSDPRQIWVTLESEMPNGTKEIEGYIAETIQNALAYSGDAEVGPTDQQCSPGDEHPPRLISDAEAYAFA